MPDTNDQNSQAVKQDNVAFTESKSPAAAVRLPGERNSIFSTVLKFSIVYLILAGMMTYFGEGYEMSYYGVPYHSVTLTPLILGTLAWIAPFAVMYSIRERSRSTVFNFFSVVFCITGLMFAYLTSFNYERWQACLKSYSCTYNGHGFFNQMSVYGISAAFILLAMVYIKYHANATKCPNCRSPWARLPEEGQFRCQFCNHTWTPRKRTIMSRVFRSRVRQPAQV